MSKDLVVRESRASGTPGARFFSGCLTFSSLMVKGSASCTLTDPFAASARVQRFSNAWNPSPILSLKDHPKGSFWLAG